MRNLFGTKILPRFGTEKAIFFEKPESALRLFGTGKGQSPQKKAEQNAPPGMDKESEGNQTLRERVLSLAA